MFWDKAYTPSQNIEALLDKEDVTVEEFLDDEDILQECKTQNRNIVNYFTRPEVIRRLIELIITEPPEEIPLSQRFKHANMACEILTFGLPSLDEKLVEDVETLQILYSYLENEPPLNPLLSSFFSKTFSMLLTKKNEQDWFLYQKMCLQFIEFIKTRQNFLELIFKHFSTPVIPDILMQLIKDVQGGVLKKNLYEWLTGEQLVPKLIAILGDPDAVEKHNNVAEFLCDLIRHGRVMRQTEENDSFEPAFVGSNPVLQTIEDENAIRLLLDVILQPNAKDSSIVSGIITVLTLIEEVIVDNSACERAQIFIDKEKENQRILISTVIRVIAPRLQELHSLLLKAPTKNIRNTAAELSPPFGPTRLQVCRLFTVLLRTGNPDITNAIIETEFFNTMLAFFKEYCWNNFLHAELEKCLQYVFANPEYLNLDSDQNFNNGQLPLSQLDGKAGGEGTTDSEVTPLQKFVIVDCSLISKLIDCWMHNKKIQSGEKGRRLGYMGHLIKILSHIVACLQISDHIDALIKSSLTEEQLQNWNVIIDSNDGEFTKDLKVQRRMLANCNAYEAIDYGSSLPKEFLHDNFSSEIVNDLTSNLSNNIDVCGISVEAIQKIYDQMGGEYFFSSSMSPEDLSHSLGHMRVCNNLDDDDNMDNGIDLYHSSADSPENENHSGISLNVNPWNTAGDPFTVNSDRTTASNNAAAEFGSDNFADFDAYFSSFTSDMGQSQEQLDAESKTADTNLVIEKSDNNANLEKIEVPKLADEVTDNATNSSLEEEGSSSSPQGGDAELEGNGSIEVESEMNISNGPYNNDSDKQEEKTLSPVVPEVPANGDSENNDSKDMSSVDPSSSDEPLSAGVDTTADSTPSLDQTETEN